MRVGSLISYFSFLFASDVHAHLSAFGHLSFLLEVWPHVDQNSLKLSIYLKMTLNFWSSCLTLLSIEIVDEDQNTWFYVVLEMELKASYMLDKHLFN